MTTRPAQFALIIAAMFAFTPPALAAGDDARPLLWDKVRSGMSLDEVRKLYPADGKAIKWHAEKQTEIEGVVILEGCKAEVEIQHSYELFAAFQLRKRHFHIQVPCG